MIDVVRQNMLLVILDTYIEFLLKRTPNLSGRCSPPLWAELPMKPVLPFR